MTTLLLKQSLSQDSPAPMTVIQQAVWEITLLHSLLQSRTSFTLHSTPAHQLSITLHPIPFLTPVSLHTPSRPTCLLMALRCIPFLSPDPLRTAGDPSLYTNPPNSLPHTSLTPQPTPAHLSSATLRSFPFLTQSQSTPPAYLSPDTTSLYSLPHISLTLPGRSFTRFKSFIFPSSHQSHSSPGDPSPDSNPLYSLPHIRLTLPRSILHPIPILSIPFLTPASHYTPPQPSISVSQAGCGIQVPTSSNVLHKVRQLRTS